MNRLLVSAVFAVLAAPAAVLAAGETVPLKLDLPKPLFVGTPRPIKIPNLEPPRTGKRPDMPVPAGTVLLSKGKPVTSSDSFPVIGELELITDGDKKGTDGTFVELGPGVQWVQIDLGAPAAIAAIALWHFHAQARVYHDVIVQAADDPQFKKNLRILFNNDHDGTARLGAGKDPAYVETNEGRLIDARGAVARYLRFVSNGSTTDEMNHYVEIEIYGQPATPPKPAR